MTIKANVKTTKEDFISFQWRHMAKYIWTFLLIIAAAVIFLIVTISGYSNTGTIDWLYAAPFILIVGLFVVSLIKTIYKINKAAKKEEQKPQFEYTFTKGNFTCRTGERSFELAWNKIYKIKEAKDMFLIYINKDSSLIIPKRSFANGEDVEMFRENCMTAVPVKKRIKK